MASSVTLPVMSKLMCRACLKEGDIDFQQLKDNRLDMYYMDLTSIKVLPLDHYI
jgi:hypothetical protein